MKIIEALRDREQARRILDPADKRLYTGTVQQQEEARRELRRNQRIARIVNRGDWEEIPRSELEFQRFGIIEHIASPNGDYYRPFGGDPEFASNVSRYYIGADGDPVMLTRCVHPSSRQEAEQMRAAREAARNAPKPRPVWMR